jgi:hypothetical protein
MDEYDYKKIITAIDSILTSTKNTKGKDQLCYLARTTLEPFIFELLTKRYGAALESHWNSCTIPIESDKALVIVERRCHQNLEFCIRNAVYFNSGFSLHIFCSEANFEFVKHICGNQFKNIHIHLVWKDLGTPELGRNEYNNLLCKQIFWNEFKEEHLIMFETDSYFLRPVPPTIFAYDYVAARWVWNPDKPGGGGISYRKKSVMLDICDRYRNPADIMQDCFASNGIKTLGYKYPSFEESINFFTESYFSNKSKAFGVHQWWTFIVQIDKDNRPPIIHELTTLQI